MSIRRWVLSILLVLTAFPSRAEDASVAHFEMTVIGSRTEQSLDEATAAAEIIDRREIEASGARDLAELLSMRANAEVETTPFGEILRLQGMDPDHVLVLVDGQRLAGRKGGAIDLSRIPLDSVARVEIIRGPASALYGSDAMGGVVQVITRRAGRPFEADGELRYGEGGLFEISGSTAGRGDAGLLRITGGLRRRDPFMLEPGAAGTTGSGYEETHLLVRGEADLGERLRLDGTASWSLRDAIGVDVGAGGAIFDRTGRTESVAISLRPSIDLSKAVRLRLTAEGTWVSDQLLQDQRGSSALDSLDEARDALWNVGLQGEFRLGSHLLVLGVEALLERMESERLEGGSGSRDRVGVYLQDEWRLAEGFRVAPGLRLDAMEGTDPQVAPRMALRWDLAQAWTVRASYGMAWRAPSFQEMFQRFVNGAVGYEVVGNPALRPEASHGGTVGAEWKPGRSFGLGIELFRQEIDDLIAVATMAEARPGQPTTYGYVNVDRARTQGVETHATIRPLRPLDLRLSYALTDARDRSTGAPLEGRARHRFSAGATWRSFDSGTDASFRVSLVGERPLPNAAGEVVDAPAYASLDAHVRQEIAAGVALIAGGQNLLDAGSVEFLPIAPRTFYGGVSFRY